ncbi:hypothetical protein BT69DRAFT_632489 [Atractiella rhizophila]|nr:hypothetical protein BT69DRAFT_632489 [Atractiella rhizophila]
MGCLFLLLAKATTSFRLLPSRIPSKLEDRTEVEKEVAEVLNEKIQVFARQFMDVGEKLAVLAFECPTLTSLPDNTIIFITCATLFTIKINFFFYRRDRLKTDDLRFIETFHCQEEILESLCNKLVAAASQRSERLLMRCSRLIRGMLQLWRERESIIKEMHEARDQSNISEAATTNADPFLSAYFDFSFAFPGLMDQGFTPVNENTTDVELMQLESILSAPPSS